MKTSIRDKLDQKRMEEGGPMLLSNNMVRALDKLFGIDPAKTEEFIRKHPSPFGD